MQLMINNNTGYLNKYKNSYSYIQLKWWLKVSENQMIIFSKISSLNFLKKIRKVEKSVSTLNSYFVCNVCSVIT